MKTYIEIPWNRYGLIAELAHRLGNKCPQFGKTVLQKMIYLLQEGLGVDCGYRFDFHAYGPFASQILQDTDFVESSEGVETCILSGAGGYLINPGKQNKSLREKAEDFLNSDDVRNKIDKLVNDFGSYGAKDLELRSTIVYVERELRENQKVAGSESVSKTVSEIKPKFSKSEIDRAISELNSRKYIASAN